MRMLIVAGGLVGAAGVALSAAAAHAGGGNAATAASFLLMHAPLFVAVGILEPRHRLLGFASVALLVGLLLFAGDLLARHYLGTRLFPMAAPAGGSIMILGWLGVAGSAILRRH